MTSFDAKIAIHPSAPLQLDSRYNEDTYPRMMQKFVSYPLKEGDLIQQVYVWDDQQPGFWGDRPVELINGRYFPQYLPLRDLIDGKEGKIIRVTILGKTFLLKCAQQEEKGGGKFEDWVRGARSFHPYPLPNSLPYSASFKVEEYSEMVRMIRERHSLSRHYEAIYYDSMQPRPRVTHVDLNTQLPPFGKIGEGGEGLVLKVQERKSLEFFALKILKYCNVNIYPQMPIAVTRYIRKQEMSPHVVKVHQIFEIAASNHYNSIYNTFVDQPEGGEARHRIGYVMELLDGDFEFIIDQLSPIESVALKIQIIHVDHLLNSQFYTFVEDDKWRNIFYKDLAKNPSFSFKGKKLIDYDFWRYTLEGQHFYIPRMRFLAMRGDYESWQSLLFEEMKPKITCQTMPLYKLRDWFSYFSHGKPNIVPLLEQLKQVPPATASVLEMD